MKIIDLRSAKTATRKVSVAALASSIVFAAGCAMQTTASDSNTFATPSGVTLGAVHGGNQPVSGATVTLYSAGQTGAGSSGVALGTFTTTATGSFQFQQVSTPSSTSYVPPTALGGNQYECGNGSDPLLYVIARGGNTSGSTASGTNNSAAVFIAPVGFCSVATSVNVNITEVTTAAMVVSTASFMNPNTEQIGADGIAVAYVALGNAFQTVSNLVSQSNGLALASRTITNSAATNTSGGPYYVSGVTVTATPETAKLNTVANILSSCVNQVSATSANNCSTLFSKAVPPSAVHTSEPSITFPTATDTLQAALYMFLNPSDSSTANLTALYNLSSATPPFQPNLSAAPTDWTIAILYQSTNACAAPSTASTFLSGPSGLAVDGGGNIWISNTQSSNSALSEMSSVGVPAACLNFGSTIAAGTRSNTAIDDAGNAWYGDTQNLSLVRFTPTTGAKLTYTTAAAPLAITADGSDNVFFTGVISGTGRLFKLPGAARATINGSATEISNTLSTSPTSAFPDSAGDIWVSSGSSFVTQVTLTASGAENGYNSTNYTVATPASSVVVGPANDIYVLSGEPADVITAFVPSGNTFTRKTGFPTAAHLGGMTNPSNLYIDGAQSTWINNDSAESSTNLSALAAIGGDGVGISPAGNTNGGYQKTSTYFNLMHSIVIDLGGNIWITNDNITNGVTEVVGGAVPIYQPYAYGITQNRFQTVP